MHHGFAPDPDKKMGIPVPLLNNMPRYASSGLNRGLLRLSVEDHLQRRPWTFREGASALANQMVCVSLSRNPSSVQSGEG